jgi:uncharacterized protein (DUF1015 family)
VSDSPSKTPFLVRPFAALRPTPESAAAVAAPPYDVMNVAEARVMAGRNEQSFLHVSRAEIDLPDDTDPYSAAVYARARDNLAALEADKVLIRDSAPTYYVYRISNASHTQTGIALSASVSAYLDNTIRRHEQTRPAKETDRVRQIEAVNAGTGPVMLVHQRDCELSKLLLAASVSAPLLEACVDGWEHRIWAIEDATTIASVSALMNRHEVLYIADGHHRSAAAARVAATRHGSAHEGFLAVSFPADAVTILDYNRVVRDLNGLTNTSFLAHLGRDFDVTAADAPVRPAAPLRYGLYLDGQWYHLAATRAPVDDDPVARLDVSVLDALVLAPHLDIRDPRHDARIDFIGGSRGPQAVAERVDSGEMAVGFTLFPTAMSDLMAVADAGLNMPPKSTWFEPKLADGLLSLPLD